MLLLILSVVACKKKTNKSVSNEAGITQSTIHIYTQQYFGMYKCNSTILVYNDEDSYKANKLLATHLTDNSGNSTFNVDYKNTSYYLSITGTLNISSTSIIRTLTISVNVSPNATTDQTVTIYN